LNSTVYFLPSGQYCRRGEGQGAVILPDPFACNFRSSGATDPENLSATALGLPGRSHSMQVRSGFHVDYILPHSSYLCAFGISR
jgi:hypothetical protein